jgi:hypothetical protein
MHFLSRGIRFALLLVSVPALVVSGPALANTGSVRVLLPYNINADLAQTTAANEDMQYVTVPGLLIVNPSRLFAQTFRPHDFHLLVGETVYYPVVRPGYNAVDLSEAGIVGPSQSQRVDVSFLVPNKVSVAKFEFTPHWQNDAGYMVDYCCLYYSY